MRYIDASIYMLFLLVGVFQCLEAYCPQANKHTLRPHLVTHLLEHHNWGERARKALGDPEQRGNGRKFWTLVCLHPTCNPQYSASSVDISYLNADQQEFHQYHSGHPYIKIRMTYDEPIKTLADVNHDKVLEALGALQAFTFRIEQWIYDFSLRLARFDEFRQRRHRFVEEYNALRGRWQDLRYNFLIWVQIPFAFYLDLVVRPQVAELLEIHDQLSALQQHMALGGDLKSRYICACSNVARVLKSHLNHKTHSHPGSDPTHGFSFVQRDNTQRNNTQRTLHQLPSVPRRNAINSITWLIAVELAYIKPDFDQGTIMKSIAEFMTRSYDAEQDQKLMGDLCGILEDLRASSETTHVLARLEAIVKQRSHASEVASDLPLITWDRLQSIESLFHPYGGPPRSRPDFCLCMMCDGIFSSANLLKDHIHSAHDYHRSLDIIWEQVGDDALSIYQGNQLSRQTGHII